MFMVMLGFGIIIPVLPYYAKSFGADSLELGYLMAVYSVMNFIFAPIWGGISDRIGRKPVLMIGLAGFAASYFLFGMATELWQLFATRIMAGVLSAAALPTVMAYVADVTTEETRARGMGMIGAAAGLGFIFGPAIGGTFSRFGDSVPFFIAGALVVANFIFAAFVLRESMSAEQRMENRAKKESSWAAFKAPLSYLFMMQFVVTLSLAGLEATFAFYSLDTFGADEFDMAMIFMIMGIAGAIVQGGLIGRLTKWLGEPGVIQLGLVTSIIGFLLITQVNSFTTAAIYLTIFGMGNGMIRPAVSALISKKTSAGQGSSMGLLGSMDSLGRIAGPVVGGSLYKAGMAVPYIAGAVISLLAMIMFFTYRKKESS
ncbi:MFS transporter [Effusibacillus lacus]|uniref:MFS transporter n=2 Tax=Effusibacillus lacus TaxID=1348429 RepID=A0A292YD78_9BACL|nr:MFS transporter [Effusibacillus lacus]